MGEASGGVRWRWAVAAVAVACVAKLGGCAHSATVTLGPRYFKHNESGYELIYAGSGPEHALGPGFVLDNYRKAKARGGRDAYFIREDPEYGFERRYDFDGDGMVELTQPRPLYDLRFMQEQGPGIIWLRSIELASLLEGKPLDVLAERYLRKAPRTGVPFAHFGEGLPTGVAEPAFAVERSFEQECQVANVAAHRVDFELRALDGAVPRRKVRIVLMRPGYHKAMHANGEDYRFEVVLLAGYSNTPDAFEAGASSFDVLLDKLSLGQGQRPHTCRGPVAQPSSP